MIGKIVKIDKYKVSHNVKQAFKRVYFRLKRGQGDYIWAKTDIVPTFRNYKHWRTILKEGAILKGLALRDKDTVDADSRPILIRYSKVEEKYQQGEIEKAEEKDLQLNLF